MKTDDCFEIGQIFRHWPGKTVTEADNNIFSLLTMNHHPIHIDKNYAGVRKHGQILVVGTYVFSLVVGLTVRDISIDAIANLEYDEVKHVKPTFIGDTLYAKTEVLNIESTESGKYYIGSFLTTGYNQNDDTVISFKRKVLYNEGDQE